MPRCKEPAIPNELLDQLLAGGAVSAAFEQGGLLDSLKKALTERALNAEMDHHLAGEGRNARAGCCAGCAFPASAYTARGGAGSAERAARLAALCDEKKAEAETEADDSVDTDAEDTPVIEGEDGLPQAA